MAARLQEKYNSEIKQNLAKTLKKENPMQVPKVTKIVVNMGCGEAVGDSKLIKHAVEQMAQITGQAPVITKARKSIAQFKIREGMAIGCKVTLRGERMYEFLDRLVTIAMPRIRDFRGVSEKSFDGKGNYALGIKEQIVFPEIDYDKVDRIRGLDVIICTDAENDDDARELLREFNMPFRKKAA